MNRENEMDKNNNQNIHTGKDSKYSDEGRDGDYNTQNTQGPGKAGGDEIYEDEKEYVSNSSGTSGEKSEEDSYVSYDGNNDQTPPSR